MGQVMGKSKKEGQTPGQDDNKSKLPEGLEQIIDKVYNDELKDKKDKVEYDDLYHAIFNIIQELRKNNGAFRFELPPKADLETAFNARIKSKNLLSPKELSPNDCREIIQEMITLERFHGGQGAMDILLFLFGIPICALMAKKFIPGMKSISDDVVIPIATTGSVIFLAKTNKL